MNWKDALADRSSIPIIAGPTASGKTELGIKLAERLDGEIISADSRQIYRGMTIGTSTPVNPPVPYHMTGFLDPRKRFSAMKFARIARNLIEDILARGKLPIIVGGTGLYIKALTEGFFEGPAEFPQIREELEKRRNKGEKLYKLLEKLDPETAERVHPNDLIRIQRALEVSIATGKPISAWQKEGNYQKLEYPTKLFGMSIPRKKLYERINSRVITMINSGWIEETRRLLNNGYSRDDPGICSLGYPQIIDYIEGKEELDSIISAIQKKTRNYAKRQITWFRKASRIIWVEPADAIENIIRECRLAV